MIDTAEYRGVHEFQNESSATLNLAVVSPRDPSDLVKRRLRYATQASTLYYYPPIRIAEWFEVDSFLSQRSAATSGLLIESRAEQTLEFDDTEDIFAPDHERRLLFSKVVDISPGALRRWEPYIPTGALEIEEAGDD